MAYRLELEERDPDLPKTYKVPGGVIARRKQPDRIVVTDEAAFVAWALEGYRDLLHIEPRVSGLRNITESEPDSALLVTSIDGEIVPGVEHVTGNDAYSAKPGA